jgi:[acyl-carrier-protein] S-malonyltransferase
MLKKATMRDGMFKAFIFPGQGSQSVGMGKALAKEFPQAREILAEVDEALRQNLSGLMFEGPQEELTLTANAQPALMAVSLAAIRVLEAEAGLELARDAGFVAGHSLGEYSALAAAGSLTVAETARLLRLRGAAMQAAVPVGAGAMAALLGLEYEAGLAIAREAAEDAGAGEVCQVANDNGGGQVVVSGTCAAVHRAIEIAKAKGARRSVLLPVSAPFHCALMQPAADAMAAALASIVIKPPCVPLVANVLAAPVTDPEEIRRLLVAQVTGAVRWRESLVFMASRGVSLFVECGAGKVLSGLVKRIAEAARGLPVGAPADIELYKAQA